MTVETATSEVAIFSRVMQPKSGTLSVAAAREWLKVDFADEDRARMHELALKSQEGTLSAQDEIVVDNYRRAGCLIDMMQSKARHSLKRRGVRA